MVVREVSRGAQSSSEELRVENPALQKRSVLEGLVPATIWDNKRGQGRRPDLAGQYPR